MSNISISILLLILLILAAIVISAAVSALITYSVYKKQVEKKIGNAEDKAGRGCNFKLQQAEFPA